MKQFLTSATAKDTYVLFMGNLVAAFLGFVLTWVIARALSVSDFGVYSAVMNLMMLLVSATDLGVMQAVVRFAGEGVYVKASLVVRVVSALVVGLVILALPNVSSAYVASSDYGVLMFTALLLVVGGVWMFFPRVLQAQKRFVKSAILDVGLGATRLVFVIMLFFVGMSLYGVLGAMVLAGVAVGILGVVLVGTRFIREKVNVDVYKNLFGFSGWLGVNSFLTSIAGRLDVSLVAALAGAEQTGYYSIPSRLVMFINVLAASFGAVIAPRFATFGSKEKEKKYFVKTVLAILPVIFLVLVWIVLARPFILFLFGEKYLPAVEVFRLLAGSMIPFLLTVPSVSVLIYAMKEPIYVGLFSIFQVVAGVALNIFLIPRYGNLGPAMAFMVIHVCLVVYSYGVVLRYFMRK